MTNCNATLTVVDLEPCPHEFPDSWSHTPPYRTRHQADCIFLEGEWRQAQVITYACQSSHDIDDRHWGKSPHLTWVTWRDGDPGATPHVDPTEDEIEARAKELHDEHCTASCSLSPWGAGWEAWARAQLLAEKDAS